MTPFPIRDRVVGLKRVDASTLVPHPENWRTHPKAQKAALSGALKQIGNASAIHVRQLPGGKLQVIDGHLRTELLGKAKVPVLITDLNEDEAKLFLATYDPLSQMAGRDKDMLAELVAKLKVDDEALQRMLGRISVGHGKTDPDDIPVETTVPVKRGEVWRLGTHRLMCGDSTVATDVAKVLGDAKPEIMVTDPPYGVDYDPAWREDVGRGDNSTGRVTADDRADWTPAWKIFAGAVAYVWHSGLHSSEVETSLRSADLIPRAQIIWSKEHLAISRGAYHWRHEPCWYAVRDGSTANWIGGRKQTTVWDNVGGTGAYGAPSTDPANARIGECETKHSTQKPAELFRRPLQNHKCATVYEPFAGSGTCIIAAEQTGKACVAIELEPNYCAVAIERWQRFTGKTATKD